MKLRNRALALTASALALALGVLPQPSGATFALWRDEIPWDWGNVLAAIPRTPWQMRCDDQLVVRGVARTRSGGTWNPQINGQPAPITFGLDLPLPASFTASTATVNFEIPLPSGYLNLHGVNVEGYTFSTVSIAPTSWNHSVTNSNNATNGAGITPAIWSTNVGNGGTSRPAFTVPSLSIGTGMQPAINFDASRTPTILVPAGANPIVWEPITASVRQDEGGLPFLPFEFSLPLNSTTWQNIGAHFKSGDLIATIPQADAPDLRLTIPLPDIIVSGTGQAIPGNIQHPISCDEVQGVAPAMATFRHLALAIPTIEGFVAIDGVPEVEETLTALPYIEYDEYGALTFQWFQDEAPIEGANSDYLFLDESLEGYEISVQVAASYLEGVLVSDSTDPVVRFDEEEYELENEDAEDVGDINGLEEVGDVEAEDDGDGEAEIEATEPELEELLFEDEPVFADDEAEYQVFVQQNDDEFALVSYDGGELELLVDEDDENIVFLFDGIGRMLQLELGENGEPGELSLVAETEATPEPELALEPDTTPDVVKPEEDLDLGYPGDDDNTDPVTPEESVEPEELIDVEDVELESEVQEEAYETDVEEPGYEPNPEESAKQEDLGSDLEKILEAGGWVPEDGTYGD